MAMQEQNVQVFNDFSGGRVTNRNLLEMTPEQCLIAHNVVFLADEGVSKRPGYTLKGQLPIANQGAIIAAYDFQRDSDQTQWLLLQVRNPGSPNSSLLAIQGTNAAGNPLLYAVTVLSATEDPLAQFSFEKQDYACYMSNGKNAYKFVDKAGVPTLYKWGIAGPAAAPTITEPAGTLTLTYGRQYVYCYVSKITDAGGTTRIHVGLPSPISAHTGPQTSKAPTLALVASADPQVTHIWIFSTFDTPANTAAVYYFNGEVTAATSSYADSVVDGSLDGTRQAPFDNNPAPAGAVVSQFQSRMVVSAISATPNITQLSGFEEIPVGIPAEAFPSAMTFKIPGGKQTVSSALVWNSVLHESTIDFWYQIAGYDAETLTKNDKVAQPGAVGKKAAVSTPKFLVWLGKDKKLYAWRGAGDPIEISWLLGKPLYGSLSMEDISTQELPNCELRYYTFGRYNWLVLLANTGQAQSGTFDWIQIWDGTFLGKPLEDNTNQILAESDMWPADLLTTSAIVQDGNQNYIFFGDQSGNLYRFPDGYTDNGKKYRPVWGSVWSGLRVVVGQPFHPIPPQNVVKRLGAADIYSDRTDAPGSFKLMTVCASAPNMKLKPVDCPLDKLVQEYDSGDDTTAARSFLNEIEGASIGQVCRFFIEFPADDQPATIYRFTVAATPLYGVNP